MNRICCSSSRFLGRQSSRPSRVQAWGVRDWQPGNELLPRFVAVLGSLSRALGSWARFPASFSPWVPPQLPGLPSQTGRGCGAMVLSRPATASFLLRSLQCRHCLSPGVRCGPERFLAKQSPAPHALDSRASSPSARAASHPCYRLDFQMRSLTAASWAGEIGHAHQDR